MFYKRQFAPFWCPRELTRGQASCSKEW